MVQKRAQKNVFYLLVILLIISPLVIAHGDENEESHWTESPWFYSAPIVVAILGAILEHYYIAHKKKQRELEKAKRIIFVVIAAVTVLVTSIILYQTIYTNLYSWSQGPVHWHADIEIWNCQERIDLVDPEGLGNRIGTTTMHEHNDDRVHIEGDIKEEEDATLGRYLNVVSELTEDGLIVPTNEGDIEMKKGDLCNGRLGMLQVFRYKITNPPFVKKWLMTQEKIEDFKEYIIAPYSNVPPGDCIIVEFAEEKEKTDHLCETYKTAISKGELAWR